MAQSHAPGFAKIISLHKDVQPAEFMVEADLCTIGRSSSCQIVIERKTVSRLHARIERDHAGRYILYDAESANGIFVNGDRYRIRKPYLLRNGDEIGLGSIEPLLRFEDTESTATILYTRLQYDSQKMQFFFDKELVELTPGQTRLLQHLAVNIDEICTRESCAEALWGRPYDPVLDDQPLNRTISNIRNQFKKIAPDIELIITHRNLGYMLLSDPG